MRPLRRYPKNRTKAGPNSSQPEFDSTPVMTRSAKRKYESVGSIHNPVNFEEELKIRKRWSPLVAYPLPELTDEHETSTMIFSDCNTEVLPDSNSVPNEEKEKSVKNQKEREEFLGLRLNYTRVTDLTKYMKDEPILTKGKDDNSYEVTFHLEESLLPQHYINEIPFDECIDINTDTIPIDLLKINNKSTGVSEDVDEFQFENALKDLLKNTAVLKRTVTGEYNEDVKFSVESAKSLLKQ